MMKTFKGIICLPCIILFVIYIAVNSNFNADKILENGNILAFKIKEDYILKLLFYFFGIMIWSLLFYLIA